MCPTCYGRGIISVVRNIKLASRSVGGFNLGWVTYMYICVYMCIYVYIYVYTHTSYVLMIYNYLIRQNIRKTYKLYIKSKSADLNERDDEENDDDDDPEQPHQSGPFPVSESMHRRLVTEFQVLTIPGRIFRIPSHRCHFAFS